MKKFNKDNLIKIIILLALAFFFGEIIITGEISNYVHPRIIPCVYFSVIGFVLMIICEIKKSLSVLEVNFEIKRYAIFCITLIFIYYMEFNNTGNFNVSLANMSYKTADINNLNKINNLAEKYDEKGEDLGSKSGDSLSKSTINNNQSDTDAINNIELSDMDGNIIINRDNFVYSLNEIFNKPQKYDGRKVEISGFVYRDSSLNNHEFIIGRYMMVCCAADLQIAGIKCIMNEEDDLNLENNTWIKLQGTISNMNNESVIKADNIEIDENPDKQYVYPF